jgi:acetyl-CoA carboxylase biotin carboxyl carrier protein
LNLEELKALLQILEEREITEFELEEENLKVRIRKGGPSQAVHVTPALQVSAPVVAISTATAPAPAALQAEGVAVPAEAAENGLVSVKSPIVGTFYRSPDPASPPFVKEGDRIRIGQVLCIIEAMKLMNEIEAEVAGEVVKILKESGQPVQYGEALFSVRADR